MHQPGDGSRRHSDGLLVIPANAGISEPLNTRVETHPLVELVEAHSAGLAVGEIPASAGMTVSSFAGRSASPGLGVAQGFRPVCSAALRSRRPPG